MGHTQWLSSYLTFLRPGFDPQLCVCVGGIDYVNKIGNNIVRD